MMSALNAGPAPADRADRSATVLIAGSDAMTRTILAAIVSNVGFPLVAAANPAEAWTAFAECAPDLVILCWDRSDFDALALCRRIRETSGKNCFVLLVTYRDDRADLVLAIAAGIDDFVRAPVEADQFCARLVMAEERLRTRRAELRPAARVTLAIKRGQPLDDGADHRPIREHA